MPGIAFVNTNRVSVRIVNESHAADGRGERLEMKLHSLLPQVSNGGVEVIDLESDRASFSGGFPAWSTGTDGKSAIADVVFGPLHASGFAGMVSSLQAENAFVEFPRSRHIRDRVTAEGDLVDANHVVRPPDEPFNRTVVSRRVAA